MSGIREPTSTDRTQQRATYTVDEAAELLGIARHTAFQAAARGEIPTIRIGRRLLVPRHRLERLLDGDREG